MASVYTKYGVLVEAAFPGVCTTLELSQVLFLYISVHKNELPVTNLAKKIVLMKILFWQRGYSESAKCA